MYPVRLLLAAAIALAARAADDFPGHCLDFDQVYDKMTVPYAPDLDFGYGPFTIEAWIRNTNTPGSQWKRIAGKRGAMEHWYSLGLGAYGSDQLFLELNSTAGYYLAGAGPPIQGDSLWHHLAAVRDGADEIRLYVDGQVYPVGTHSGDLSNEHDLEVGIFGTEAYGGESYQGQIEELRLWNTARTTQQIRECAHLTLNGDEPGLAAYWQFNEGAGSTATDYTGGNLGTLIGAGWAVSPAPVGSGFSFTHLVDGTGMYEFTAAGLTLDYSAFTGLDTVVVSRLELAPNLPPGLEEDFDAQYWVLQRFGSGVFLTDAYLLTTEDILEQDVLDPARLVLSQRATNSIGAWSGVTTAFTADSLLDQAGFSGLESFSQWMISRVNLPVVLSLSPGDDGSGVDENATLRITFDRPMTAGAGGLRIRHAEDDSLFAEFSATELEIADSLITIDPAAPFILGTQYYVEVEGDAFQDDQDQYFSGFSDPEDWNFQIEEFLILDVSPADDTVAVELNDSLRIAFNRPVAAGPGSLWIRHVTDGSLFEEIAATEASIADSVVTVYHSMQFMPGTGYYVQIDADAFNNGGPSYFPGMSDPEGWDFHTIPWFSDSEVGLPGTGYGSTAWGDYDGDGDLDVLLTGSSATGPLSRIYRNDDGFFVEYDPGFVDLQYGSGEWGDFDNDGDLDVVITGYDG